MSEWWRVHDVLRAEWLSLPEWELLLAGGHPWKLERGEKMSWRLGAGVIIVTQGRGQLATERGGCFQLLPLRGGDAVGTLQPTRALLEAHTPTQGYLFCHSEWLRALQQVPELTRKLLFGMAGCAMSDELGPARGQSRTPR